MKILEIHDEILKYYKICTKGNENITRDQAARKLTRNVMLGMEVPPRNKIDRLKGNRMIYYGNLHIVLRGNKVVHLSNHFKGAFYGGWKLDQDKHAQLTKQLGII